MTANAARATILARALHASVERDGAALADVYTDDVTSVDAGTVHDARAAS